MEGAFSSNVSLPLHHGPELVPVHQNALLFDIFFDLAGDHLHRHADLHFFFSKVGELGGDHGSFVKGNDRHGIGGVLFVPGRRIAQNGVGIDFALAAEGERGLGFAAAFRADIARGEDL